MESSAGEVVMKQKDKNYVSQTLGLISIFLVIIFQADLKKMFPFLNNGYILTGFTLLVGFIVTLFFLIIIPTAKSKRKRNTKNKAQNKQNKRQVHNLLRSDDEILTLPLKELSWREFEKLCYLFYKAKGYKPRETTEGADGGVDLIIYNRYHQQDVAIQVKHWIDSDDRVSVKEIRELDSAKKNHKCILAEFISSTGYTRDALIEADKRKIKCHTADKILKWKEQEVLKRNLA